MHRVEKAGKESGERRGAGFSREEKGLQEEGRRMVPLCTSQHSMSTADCHAVHQSSTIHSRNRSP